MTSYAFIRDEMTLVSYVVGVRREWSVDIISRQLVSHRPDRDMRRPLTEGQKILKMGISTVVVNSDSYK